MDWQVIEDLLCDIYAKRRGNSAWPPLFMLKALLLQSWHNLSDPGLEKQLARGLLFRRFVDLSLADSVPDHSSIWRFRQLCLCAFRGHPDTRFGIIRTLISV
jgi:IS5 family transposase